VNLVAKGNTEALAIADGAIQRGNEPVRPLGARRLADAGQDAHDRAGNGLCPVAASDYRWRDRPDRLSPAHVLPNACPRSDPGWIPFAAKSTRQNARRRSFPRRGPVPRERDLRQALHPADA
jgi:hypothetical protein